MELFAERGYDNTTAAEIGEIALNVAYTRWLDPASEVAFGELTREALDELRAATAELGQPSGNSLVPAPILGP